MAANNPPFPPKGPIQNNAQSQLYHLPTDRLVTDCTTASPFHHPLPCARISQGLGARPVAGSRGAV